MAVREGRHATSHLVAEQIAYYRRRAPEYDATSAPPGDPFAADTERIRAALRAFAPRGRVLELAAGTGQWTALLAELADELTAVDASPEMLGLNRARVADPRVSYVEADAFAYEPPRPFDVVFFAFWLSHVPLERFQAFWSLVGRCLAPGGRVFFIDEARHDLWQEERAAGDEPSVVRRRLRDGSVHRIVKVLWEAPALEARLLDLGWAVEVRRAGPFYFGEGSLARDVRHALRVVSWNMQAKTPARVGLQRVVEEWRPDLLLLQEVKSAELEADESLAASLPHRFMHSPAGYRAVTAIVSAHPVRDTGILEAPRDVFDRPRLVWAELLLPGDRRMVAASVHTSSPYVGFPLVYYPPHRNRQLVALHDYAQELMAVGAPVVVGGDFNTIRYAIPGMTDAALAVGAPRPTWRGLASGWLPPMLRLDRIFVGPGVDVAATQVWRGPHGSDHFPLRADLGFG